MVVPALSTISIIVLVPPTHSRIPVFEVIGTTSYVATRRPLGRFRYQYEYKYRYGNGNEYGKGWLEAGHISESRLNSNFNPNPNFSLNKNSNFDPGPDSNYKYDSSPRHYPWCKIEAAPACTFQVGCHEGVRSGEEQLHTLIQPKVLPTL